MKRLLLWEDPTPRHAAESMAWDHALFASASLPVLRVYRWSEPCVSCGYFARAQQVDHFCEGLPWVRRWTGGGLVRHGRDWAYTLAIPRNDPVAQMPAAESYRWIHARICEALTSAGSSMEARFSLETARSLERPDAGSPCFNNPVLHDVIWNGKKVGGAGQRRTQNGLLHQGSLLLPPEGHPDAQTVAAALAETWERLDPAESMDAEVQAFLQNRYATREWNHLR